MPFVFGGIYECRNPDCRELLIFDQATGKIKRCIWCNTHRLRNCITGKMLEEELEEGDNDANP